MSSSALAICVSVAVLFLLLFQTGCSHATWGMCSWRTGWRCRCYFFHLIFFTFVCFLFSLQEHHRSYLLFFVCCLDFAFLCLPFANVYLCRFCLALVHLFILLKK